MVAMCWVEELHGYGTHVRVSSRIFSLGGKLVPDSSFSRARAGRNASRGTFLRQKRGTGNEAILRSLVGFGVSPHGQLCLHSHLHSITLVACKF